MTRELVEETAGLAAPVLGWSQKKLEGEIKSVCEKWCP
jgi:hypothetical protein